MRKISKKRVAIALVILSALATMPALTSCGSKPSHATLVDEQPHIFPDYAGTTIPVDIAPFDFNVVGDSMQSVFVTVRGSKEGEIEAHGDYADFDVDDWHKLTEANKGGQLTFTVYARQGGEWKQYRDFTVEVSNDPLGEWGLTYRLIPPGYEVYGKMGIYQRDLSNFEETAILENTAVPGACLNCHTSNQTSPDRFTFHIRGDHGGTLISEQVQVEMLKAKNDSLKSSMVYPYWHPSGQWIAYSTNNTHQSFHAVRGERVEVFDQASDVLIYHPATHRIVLNPNVMTKDHYENYPVFSPDGRTLYFVSADAWDIPANYKRIKYNICQVGFDPQTGHTVGRVDTIFNARGMGKSANHPRPSYNGRFLLFTMSDYGCFPIWHKEADQWLLDLRTMKARPLDKINSPNTDSYHNWSRNSHWIVFTSRRINGYYTQLYLAHVDDNGRMGKPFLLPQRAPGPYYDRLLYSYNTPDFTLRPVKLDARKTANRIMDKSRAQTLIMHN